MKKTTITDYFDEIPHGFHMGIIPEPLELGFLYEDVNVSHLNI